MSPANDGHGNRAARTLKPNLMAAANSAPISKTCRPIPLPAFRDCGPSFPPAGADFVWRRGGPTFQAVLPRLDTGRNRR
jgi:hypothetical protein